MFTSRSIGPRRAGVSNGFTLVEMLVTFSALMVVLLGFSRMLLASQMAASTTHEATLAKEGARAVIERLQAEPLAGIYAAYSAAPGFAVRGLDAPADDADGLPGRIFFPETGGVLSEFATQPQHGWPIDMDGDGLTSTANVSATYRRLPVVVRVDWRGKGGDGSVEFKTVLGGL